ncbi:CBO0543 family protein [Paenibacillus sp. SN-8-1]|uniref:CBO0543 family protein n=1 Tax=Paenibacillus sp. SN-8-1 TaxID=3435409 RepID=UPI003D9A2CA3
MNREYPSFQEIAEVDRKLSEMRTQYYIHHDLFSLQWWFLLCLLIVPWFIWWKLLDKSRAKEIMLYGASISIIIVILDDLGGELHFWAYSYQLFRFLARLSPIDYSVLPVCHMLIFQYFRSWKSFFWANLIFGLGAAFIAEPFFVWIKIYKMYTWRYIYSVPLYVIKAMAVKGVLEFIQNMAKKRVKET